MDWKCVECTFLNEHKLLACKICGTEKPASNLNGDGWKCLNCTFQNVKGSKTCIMCNNPKPHPQIINKPQPQPQLQPHPHPPIHNDNPLLIDNNDNNINDSKIDDNSFWICSECTYVNNYNININNRCDLCDGLKKDNNNDNHSVYSHCDNNNNDDNDDNDNLIFNNQFSINLPSNPTFEHFSSVLDIIVAHSPNHRSAITVLKSLKKITSRVSDHKPKYRVLDTRTKGVQTKLLGFEGSLEYLQLLGYTLDPTQIRLQCLKHPPVYILNKVNKLIDFHLIKQREKINSRKQGNKPLSTATTTHTTATVTTAAIATAAVPPQQQQQQVQIVINSNDNNDQKDMKDNLSDDDDDNDDNDDDDDDSEDLKLDGGDFTLTQLVGLVTHEILCDSDAIRVLLLCHRCFSDSLELIEAIRKRFFVPAPIEANLWNENQIILWCQNIQRPIQNKCIQILCEWITNYFCIDFWTQNKVLNDLKKFTQQVLECKYESDDGWYDSLAILLTSAIENGEQQQLKLINDNVDNANANPNPNANIDNVSVDNLDNLLNINYLTTNNNDKKKKKKGLFSSKKNRDNVVVNKNKIANGKLMVFEYTSSEMAEQITLQDFEYFSKIHTREFLEKVWKSTHNIKSKNDNIRDKYYPNLQKMIDRFNAIHKYIILSVVYCKSLDNRVKLLSHFIDCALHLLELRNFFSLMAVFSALDSIAISKLKYLWLRIETKYKSLLKNLSTVCDASNNFKSLRKLMRRSFSARIPTIPYIGVFLSDLTFVNEGAAKLVEGFINFKRFERFTERCKIVKSFQSITYNNNIVRKTKLYYFIQNDINIFNKLGDDKVKLFVQQSVQLDEKNATNQERQIIKLRNNNKNNKRNLNKNNKNKNKKNKNNKNNAQLFRRFKK